MVHTQKPTCQNVRIRSTQDTHKIFYAIQKGHLKMVTRRLDADERLALRSGCVYAWEERGPHSEITGLGIERFTEGRRWTPSRVRDEFLFYYERYMPPPDNSSAASGTEAKPPRDWEPMVKQTYSVWVDTDNGRRKWHLTAYFTQGTIDQLGTVDDLPDVRELVVPEGVFKSTRVGKSRTKHDESRSESTSGKSSTVTRTYAAFPSPYPIKPAHNENANANSQPVLMYPPYQNTTHSGYYHAQPVEVQPQPEPHSRVDSHSQSPQNRSPASLSPTIPPSTGLQYVSERAQIVHTPSPSYTDVPGVSGHSHSSDYRDHSPGQATSATMSDHGQRENFSSTSWNTGNSMPAYPYQAVTVNNQFPTGSNHTTPMLTNYGFSLPPPDGHYPRTESGLVAASSPSFDERSGEVPPVHAQHVSSHGSMSPYELTNPTPSGLPLQHDFRDTSHRALAPLYALNRQQPYRREQIDDKALRLLQNAPSAAF